MKKFYPVVHCFDFNQTQYNLLLALKHKADGVFLIDHNQMSELTFDLIVDTISAVYKDQIKIGANFLNLSNIEALEKAVDFGLDMLWVDNANEYLPYIDKFLVASSILDKKDERLFDEEKLKMLREIIHEFKA